MENGGYFNTQFYGIEPHASPLCKTVSISPECIISIPKWTLVVFIALYRKMQSFGATLKCDPHFSRLMGKPKPFWWHFKWKCLGHVLACQSSENDDFKFLKTVINIKCTCNTCTIVPRLVALFYLSKPACRWLEIWR